MKLIIVAVLFCLLALNASAGDAIAVGYNCYGVWTAVTYNRSLTPKDGPNYHLAGQACTLAVRDLHIRASEDLVRTKIIGQSDQTGYVTVARGRAEKRNTDVTTIGRGASQSEADRKALQKLKVADAATNEEIVYRYFSYGADSTPARPRSKQSAKRSRR
jgi:hypothetical protein